MKNEIIIDASESPMGRVASLAAKEALEGKEVFVINSEKAIITGNKKNIINEYNSLKLKGKGKLRGPFISKDPEKIMKRCIRGMLPNYRIGRGSLAWKRIRCYKGIPSELSNKNFVRIPIKKVNKKYIVLEEIK